MGGVDLGEFIVKSERVYKGIRRGAYENANVQGLNI